MLKNIHSVLLYVSNVQASLEFYRDKLGFTEAFREGDGFAWLMCGSSGVALHSDKQVGKEYFTDPKRRGQGVLLHIEVENIDAYSKTLKQRGVALSCEPTDEPWGWRMAALTDPDGYYLTFFHRLKNAVC